MIYNNFPPFFPKAEDYLGERPDIVSLQVSHFKTTREVFFHLHVVTYFLTDKYPVLIASNVSGVSQRGQSLN